MNSLHLTAREVLSTKSPSFRALGVDPAQKSDDELIALMAQEPRLIRRPLIVVNGKAVVGFDKEMLRELL